MNKTPPEGIRTGAAARQLGVSNATMRNYVREFGEFLSPNATKPTGRRFLDDDLATLRYAISHLRQGASYEQVRGYLEHEQPMRGEVLEDFEQEQEPDPEIPFEDAGIAPLEFFENIINQMQDQHQREIAAKDDLIAELREDKQRLQDRLDRPWYKRIFGG